MATAVRLPGTRGGRRHLAERSFADPPLAVVDTGTPAPLVLTGDEADDGDDAPGRVLEAGARAAEEAEVSSDAVTDRLRSDPGEAREG